MEINSPCTVCGFKDYEYLPKDSGGYINVRCKKCGSFPYKIGGSQNSVELQTLNPGYMDKRKKQLIKKAKEKKLFTYEEFGELFGYDMENIDERNRMAEDIGSISRYEHNQGRPMLSVLVGYKNIKPFTPADSFFNYMDELRVRKPKETNEQLRNRLMNWCYEYWSKH